MAKDKDKLEKTNVMRLLDAAGVAYTPHSYSVSDGLIDGLSVAKKIGFPPEQVFKTLVALGASNALLVFVIPVERELELKKAAKAAAEKSVRLCPAKDLLKNTGYIHGGCSPLGMKRPLPTFIDESAILLETMVCSAGKIGSQIETAPDDLLALTNGSYADLV